MSDSPRNILGSPLTPCAFVPTTGFFRDGCCHTGVQDPGSHTVCVQVTRDFLDFSLDRGNDLSTPQPYLDFPGLEPGDRWCLCAARWKKAPESGLAPPVILEATHEAALEVIPLADLLEHAVELTGDPPPG